MLSLLWRHRFRVLAPLIVLLAISGVLFECLFLFDGLSEAASCLLATSAVLLDAMCMISYYKSIIITNNPPPNLVPPRSKITLKHNHPIYTQRQLCSKEGNRVKPPRTSHCSLCGCVARMDHHCPYINNCLGGSNFKAFILFTGYGGFFALQFVVLSIRFYIRMVTGEAEKLSEGLLTLWMVLTVVIFVCAVSMLGLCISNLIMLSRSLTRIDLLKGTFLFRDYEGTSPNPYDLGLLANFYNLFGNDCWMFWWPGETIGFADFTEFPMVPPITDTDKKQLFPSVQQLLADPFEKSIPKTIARLRQVQLPNYQNVVFFYLGEKYTLDRKEEGYRGYEQTVSATTQLPAKSEEEMATEKEALNDIYDGIE